MTGIGNFYLNGVKCGFMMWQTFFKNSRLDEIVAMAGNLLWR